MPDDITQPDVDLGQAQTPDVGQAPTATPQLANQQPSGPRPILLDLIQGLVHPRMQASGPGQMAQPVSRAQTFENFLGNFVYALGQGFANAGHGPGSAARGAGAAIGAPLQLQAQQAQIAQQRAAQQAEIAKTQAQTAQTQQQTGLSGSMVTVPGPQGPVQVPYDVAVKGGYLRGAAAAQTAAQAKITEAQLKVKLMTGQIGAVKPTPDGGWMAYNKFGQQIGPLKGSVDPAMLNKFTKTEEFREDKDGNLVAVPKTTVRGVVPNAAPGTAVGGPARFPQSTPSSGKASGFPRQPSSGGRVVMQGKTAADLGVAFNPQTNEYEETTRNEASSSGLQNFGKITGKEHEDNRVLNNRLVDVDTKLRRYQDSTAPGVLSQDDKSQLARILQDDKFKLGVMGASVPVDAFNEFLKANRAYNLSDNGKRAMWAYLNARESMAGYQRVLAGSNRGGEKQMQLNLDALPSPVFDDASIKEGLTQFLENVKIAANGLPRMKGITKIGDNEMVDVHIPGEVPGRVPRGRLGEFRRKHPAARVSQ